MPSSTSSQSCALICPRCRSQTIELLSTSPVKDVWVVYVCKKCFYAWRSTEPEENTNPDHYPPAFRLKPEEMHQFPELPTIPPLREKTSSK